ncbi:alkylation response protein AidB-like acyl-CoA dehydrogenase [Constrictibacter sp. MBR-5]|jgi:alkylation response protein AidB-like acyl-CoA dehydrogenase|uniref:acyl-CoA dehydrogenase family protein n=1 Tax=Constrictibacter sp. MBR-5 TaxID=3156467 RepID=UPI00339748B6
MDISLSPEVEAFRAEVRAWVRDNLPRDIWEKVDRGIELTRDDNVRWMRILSEKGWVATNWDKADGGPGFTTEQKYVFEEELFLAGAPRIIHYGTRMVGPVLLAFGTEDQKRRYLPKILSSEEIWCQGYSEPGSGSDLASLQMKAVRDGDHYVVSGTKIWTTQAHCADRMFALVRTSTEPKKQDGITCLLIDLKAPGVTVRPIITLDGRHIFNQEFFDDVRVPVADRVGEEGQGWRVAKYLLGHERSNGSFVSIGKRLLAKLKAIAAAERRDGARLIDDPAFRRKVAESEQELGVLEFTSWRTLASASADRPVGPEASVLKTRTADTLKQINELMMEAGAYYAQPFEPSAIRGGWNGEPVGPDYLFRMAPEYFESRARSIAGGSNEVQKSILAKAVLGL